MKHIILISLLSLSGAFAWVPPQATTSSSSTSPTQLSLFHRVEDAISEAQRICAADPLSQECRVAWEVVEELEAADSHRSAAVGANGNAADLLALLESFDILSDKIDRKMDQLQATTERLVELGAPDPAVADLGFRAQEMKEHLAYVQQSLRQAVQ